MPAQSLQELVSTAACLHADRAAVLYDSGAGGTGGSESLLYREVAQLANELSAVLLKNCSNSGVIGLFCSDDLLVPVWILGILQSTAAYVPLDPEAPGLLSARIINQCGLKYCAVKRELVQRFHEILVDHISVDVCVDLPELRLTLMHVEPHPASKDGPQRDKRTVLKNSGHPDLAYVLHTSGTTGPPKTVRVPHVCIVPNILHLRSLFQMSTNDVVFLASPLTFDPSVVDIFLALSSGALLLMVPAVIKKMPGRLAQLLFKDHRTTVLQATPTLLTRFGHRVLKRDVLSSGSSLRVLALGGEACPSLAQLRSWKHEDNKTSIYNIYGITEVSCWASCYRIPELLLRSNTLMPSSVALGTPLMDTVVEVRDEGGCVITEGEGQVFIGGQDRVCLLDGEDTVVPGTMRATGDWVNVKDKQLYYLGRRDRMIKRNGKRVNLDSLQQLLQNLPQVEACAVGLWEGFRLIAFVVASSEVHRHQGEPVGAEGDLQRVILRQLSPLVSSHCIPDALVLVPAISLTPHGKADMKALMKIYEKQRECLRSSQLEVGGLKKTLQTLWQDILGLPADASIDERSNFLFSGGDSLKALRLCEDILTAVGVSSPQLLEVILDRSFSDVLRHVTQTLQAQSGSLKKRTADLTTAVPLKRRREFERTEFKVVRRGGEVEGLKRRDADTGEEPSARKGSGNDLNKDFSIALSLSWSSDTGRCVDASPVILVQDAADDRSRATVFIGSHSHRIQALDVLSGNLVWERVLGDRIEASAAVSHCGSFIIVGSYDGCVYFLCTKSGETKWVFKTEDAVKSSPAVDPLTGLVVAGSHDGHVYALDPQRRQLLWKRHCGGGAVFSSPHLQSSDRRLYVASLGGRLVCLNLDSGDILWSYCRDKPFFSSPSVFSGHAVIGSVDGNICCLSDTGELQWQFLTEAPVFSSPSFVPGQQRVLCGSHDGRLYCLNCTDGSLVWTFQTSGKVYSTPFVFEGSAVGSRGALVGLASTDGTVWILDAENGRVLASHVLPGELFSSPVVWEQSLVIGCRNDYVYCLNLTTDV